MEAAERSWYLEQIGIPEWIPRDAAAQLANAANDSAAAVAEDSSSQTAAPAVTAPATAAAEEPATYNGPKISPSDILAKLRESNGPKAKKQLDEGSQLAEEFTTPPTAEQLKKLAEKPVEPVAPVETTKPPEPIADATQQTASVVPAAAPVVNKPQTVQPVVKQSPATAVPQIQEPDFSVEEPDVGDLEALFAESIAFEGEAQPAVDEGPDTLEKLDRDWKLMLAQAGCLPASLGEGAKDPAVIVITALPANQFDNRQLDCAWRLRGSILKAAKLPAKRSFHSSLYSVSSNVKPASLLKRLRALHPNAILLCFASAELEADLKELPGKVLCLPSVDQMLSDAALKRKAWDQLQKAIPAFEKLAK